MAKRKKNLDDMTVDELHAEASARDIPGRSSMNRDELVAALSAAPAPEPAAGEPELVPGPDPFSAPAPGSAPAPAAPPTPAAPAPPAADAKFAAAIQTGGPFPTAAPGPPVSLPVPNPIPSGPPGPAAAPGVNRGQPDFFPLPAAPGMRKARVTIPGTHVGTIDVEIPAALAGAAAITAAVEAAKAARGISTFGAGPVVELL